MSPIPTHTLLLGVHAAESEWSPLDLPNLVGWWDCSDTATIIDAGAGAVSQVNDKSGVGNHATQGTSTKRPITGTRNINELNVIDFDGANDSLALPNLMSGASAGTSLVVFQLDADPAPTNTKTGAPFGHFGTGDDDRYTLPGDSRIYTNWGSTVRKDTIGTGGSLATVPALVSIVSAASDWRMYVNTTVRRETTTNTVGWSTTPFIGTSENVSFFMDGRWAEGIIYSSALGTTDRQDAENYLKAKWGTP